MSLYFIDAQTEDTAHRLTVFGVKIDDVVRDFGKWYTEEQITQEMLWYADIFDGCEKRHIASLRILGNGCMAVVPAPEGSTLDPFHRKMGPVKFVKVKYHEIRDMIYFMLHRDEYIREVLEDPDGNGDGDFEDDSGDN